MKQPALIAERLQLRLADDSESDAELHLRQLAALGDAGLEPLVRSLASRRQCVREAARPLIIETVGRWELLTDDVAANKLALLAAALADAAPQLDATNRRFASDLTMRILHWPREENARGQAALLSDCQRVLAILATQRDSQTRSDATITQNAVVVAQPPAGATAEDRASWTMIAMSRLPGGGLPIELASRPPDNSVVGDRAVAKRTETSADDGEPRRLADQRDSRSLSGADSSTGPNRSLAPNQPSRLPGAEDQPNRLAQRPTAQLLTAQTNRSDETSESDSSELRNMPLHELFRHLHASNSQGASGVATELARRGITGSLLDLARQAGDPNPQIRRQLAERLPRVKGVDARPWLLELSYDEDPKVRVTAVTLMATSGDMDLLKRVQQVSREDPDDQTRAQAQKALPDFRRR